MKMEREDFMVLLKEALQQDISIQLDQKRVKMTFSIFIAIIHLHLLEGWVPTTFKSSRSSKATYAGAKPEDFMDENDKLQIFGSKSCILPYFVFNLYLFLNRQGTAHYK